MASKTVLILLTLTVITSVVLAEWELTEDQFDADDENNITLEDLEDYFVYKRSPRVEADRYQFLKELMDIEKRGRGRNMLGSCKTPKGKLCELCNLKVRNKSDMRRYIACHNARRG